MPKLIIDGNEHDVPDGDVIDQALEEITRRILDPVATDVESEGVAVQDESG